MSRTKKIFANLICCLIPLKKLRRRARNFLLLPFGARNYIISLGHACFAAGGIAKSGGRRFSGPFDWCWGSSCNKKLEIIFNKFAHFFDKRDFDHIGIDPNNHYQIYHNTNTDIFYNHDFGPDSDFNTEYPIVFDKYTRRIDRVMKILNKRRARVLLVYGERVDGPMNFDLHQLTKIMEKLNKKYPAQIRLLYIKHNLENNDESVIRDNQYIFTTNYIHNVYSPQTDPFIEELIAKMIKSYYELYDRH
ncbi:MAG: papain-like cysteine peptidase [Rickettsiales bacterium]|nr:papain-like cysteine peptidase [Rickettsiales bacterium]